MPHQYASRNDLKARLGISASDTADDAVLDALLEAVSRQIEQHCRRWFYPATQTRVYTAARHDRVLVDDLLAVTTLKTDEDGDRTYEVTWAATDYDLQPDNARLQQPPEPYWAIATTPDGAYTFPTGVARGVQVVGSWGALDERETSTATLSGALDASSTSVSVSSGSAFEVGQTILIGSEQLWISAISGNTLTVRRGQNGTTAAAHSNGAAIQLYTYSVVGEACLLQAALSYVARDAPAGVRGGEEFEQPLRGVGLHPFVRAMLAPLRRL